MADDNTRTPRVWFVTGATSGFGRAMGLEVLRRGDRLVATAREPERLEEFESASGAITQQLDVTDPTAARHALDEAVSACGRVDVVFNNAGFAGSVGAAEEVDDEWLRDQLDTNLFGVINVTRAALPHMRKQRSGHLLQMSSLNGVEGLPGGAYYATSKFGIEGFSESLAGEVAALGIKVTIVEPGPHRTQFLDERNVKWEEGIADYAASVGETREQLRGLDGAQPGDPARAVRAMIEAVESDSPPLRLPLGEMALEEIRSKLRGQLDELESWAKVSASSDFPAESAA